jgi:hypothetical protein
MWGCQFAREPLGVAARAEVATLAREGEQVLVRAAPTPGAREGVLQDPARQKPLGDRADDRPPRAERLGEALVLDRVQLGEVRLDAQVAWRLARLMAMRSGRS